jgi:hypothetical protein
MQNRFVATVCSIWRRSVCTARQRTDAICREITRAFDARPSKLRDHRSEPVAQFVVSLEILLLVPVAGVSSVAVAIVQVVDVTTMLHGRVATDSARGHLHVPYKLRGLSSVRALRGAACSRGRFRRRPGRSRPGR